MKITFCLPELFRKPIGGYKIVYEYANRLSKRGYDVSIVFLGDNQVERKIKIKYLNNILSRLFNWYYPKWFKLDDKIRKIPISSIIKNEFPDSDIVFATGIETVETVKNLEIDIEKKFYLIQDFEDWAYSKEQVIESYKLGFQNIVVSKWLFNIVSPYSPKTKLISNPIDTNIFKVINPIESRNPFMLSMLYHTSEKKGIPDAITAIKKVHKKYPDLRLHLFGIPKKPDFLEEWMTYTQNASTKELQKIYNETGIFVCASIDEGFGLTGAESMACGAALASTSYTGVFDYAENEVTALLSPVGNPDALSENIIKLINDESLRIKLAKKGSQQFLTRTWEKSVDKLERLFENVT